MAEEEKEKEKEEEKKIITYDIKPDDVIIEGSILS